MESCSDQPAVEYADLQILEICLLLVCVSCKVGRDEIFVTFGQTPK